MWHSTWPSLRKLSPLTFQNSPSRHQRYEYTRVHQLNFPVCKPVASSFNFIALIDICLQHQVVRLEEDPSASGWQRFKISLPQSFRAQWMDDLVFNEEWRELISDFDQKLLGTQAAVAMKKTEMYAVIRAHLPTSQVWSSRCSSRKFGWVRGFIRKPCTTS